MIVFRISQKIKKLAPVLLCVIVTVTSAYCQTKEVVKISVDKDCNNYIGKRQFKGELYTKPLNIISGFINKANLTYAYKDNRQLIYFTLNDKMFLNYESSMFYIKIDNREFVISGLVDFQEHASLNGWLDAVSVYVMGFELNPAIGSYIKNAKTISISMINLSNQVKKTWELKNSTIEEIKNTYNCFVAYFTPIENEYISNLKLYPTNFRTFNWNDSRNFVVENEESKLLSNSDTGLSYEVVLNNDNFNAHFFFNDDRLYMGAYYYNGEHVNENNYYKKMNELSRILERKYGAPRSINKYRNGDLYKDADDIGRSIETGYYEETRIWETKNSIISLEVSGENFDIDLVVRYLTKENDLLIAAKEKALEKSSDGF